MDLEDPCAACFWPTLMTAGSLVSVGPILERLVASQMSRASEQAMMLSEPQL